MKVFAEFRFFALVATTLQPLIPIVSVGIPNGAQKRSAGHSLTMTLFSLRLAAVGPPHRLTAYPPRCSWFGTQVTASSLARHQL